MRKIRRGFFTAIIIFVVLFSLVFIGRDEIFFAILKSKNNLTLGEIPNPPYSYKYFCAKDKSDFLISKFNDERKANPTLCGCPLTCGDLAWCLFSDGNISEEQYELLMKAFNVDYGFAVFQNVRGDYARKIETLEIIGFECEKIRSLVKDLGNSERYEIFCERGMSFYGDYDFAVYCDDMKFNGGKIEYKFFNKISGTVFSTISSDEFIKIVEQAFSKYGLQKINVYGHCTRDTSFDSLCNALKKSDLIEWNEVFSDDAIDCTIKCAKANTKSGVDMEFTYDCEKDMICTCSGN